MSTSPGEDFLLNQKFINHNYFSYKNNSNKIFLYSHKRLKSKRVGKLTNHQTYNFLLFYLFYVNSVGFNSFLLSHTHTHITYTYIYNVHSKTSRKSCSYKTNLRIIFVGGTVSLGTLEHICDVCPIRKFSGGGRVIGNNQVGSFKFVVADKSYFLVGSIGRYILLHLNYFWHLKL